MDVRVKVLGIPISVITTTTVIPAIENLLGYKQPVHIVTPNPEHIIQAQKDPEFAKVLKTADLAVPDGVGVVWAAQKSLDTRHKAESLRSNQHVITRVTGVDLMLRLCDLSQTKGWRVGLMGGRHGVADEAATKLCHQYPELEVVVIKCPDTMKIEDSHDEVVATVNHYAIEVLFVALGAPKQELWIARNLPYLKTVKIAMGVGGAFDFISGGVNRAPLWLQAMGLEWLFRLATQPWRFKRQLRLAEFAWKVMRENSMRF